MSKKSSFFEKLTGASWSSEKEEVKVVPKKNGKSKKKIIKKDFSIEEKSLPSKIKDTETEEILAESEGQLTIDVYQTPEEVVIKSTIAGVRAEDIDISMNNDMITIKGKRAKDEVIPEKDYYYQECYWGSFSRSVILPVDVESDKAQASMKNGILTVKLPKVRKTLTKKITIIAE